MSDKPTPNELYDELEGQLVKADVERIKNYLHNNPIAPYSLEECKRFPDICRELQVKGKIKPAEDDYSFLERMFKFLGMITLKEMVTKFAAKCRSISVEASEHTITEHASASKDKDYADPDKYRNDGRSHYRSSGRSDQADATNDGQGGNSRRSGDPQGSSNESPDGSAGNFRTVTANAVTINQTIYNPLQNQAAGTHPEINADADDTNQQEQPPSENLED